LSIFGQSRPATLFPNSSTHNGPSPSHENAARSSNGGERPPGAPDRTARGPFLPFLILFATALSAAAQPVIIGSKKFTESYVLAEIAKRKLTDGGIPAEHRQGMGGTIILWEALRGGQIDIYPEYTGTITQEILKSDQQVGIQQIENALGKIGIGMTEPLGFNNTYALVMRRDRAEQLGIRAISDLQKHPKLTIGLTHEFLDRHDGWRPLAMEYQLNPRGVIGIDHALGYAASRTARST